MTRRVTGAAVARTALLVTHLPTRRRRSPRPGPLTAAGARGLHRVAIQPRPQDVRACMDWWTVDLLVDGAGRVRFVTIDVGEP